MMTIMMMMDNDEYGGVADENDDDDDDDVIDVSILPPYRISPFPVNQSILTPPLPLLKVLKSCEPISLDHPHTPLILSWNQFWAAFKTQPRLLAKARLNSTLACASFRDLWLMSQVARNGLASSVCLPPGSRTCHCCSR